MAIPLVVGIDGSEASLQAVEWAVDEAVRHSVSLHLVHAAGGDREPSGVIGAASERARGRAPMVQLSSEVLHEDAAAALVDRGRNAFALVLGSRGLGDLAEMLLGAVGLAVAARADCPVVVVRGAAEHRDGRFGNIVVGVEEGEGSGTALQFASREAHVRSCRLTAVHAWNPSSRALTTRPAPSWYAMEAHRRPSQVLDDALRGLAERYRDARVSSRVIEGPARRALLDAASEADLLVVGARRRHGHAGLQLGLINHALLHHAPVDLGRKPARQGLSALYPELAAGRRWEQVVGDGRRVAGGPLMSARSSPYASGPPSRRGDHAHKGANSLRRTSDRFEGWFRRVLTVVLVLGLPAAAVSAGLTAYEASMRTVRAQAAERHQVTARLTAGVKSDDDWAKRPVQVRWTDTNGVVRTGAALVKPGTPKGATVRVWVTRDGTITGPPASTLNATTNGWLVGGMAAFGVAAGSRAAWAGMRLVLDRRRYARWDAEWDLVEPQWSARFRR